MTEWSWEYFPDAEHVVGGLGPADQREVEKLSQRLADAASVRYLGEPAIEDSGVSRVQDHAEGRLMLWYQEHRRLCLVFVLRVQFWPVDGG